MKTFSFLIVSTLFFLSCKKDPRTAFYGTWKMTEIEAPEGRLNFNAPDSFIQQLVHNSLDAELQRRYKGDGEYEPLTAEDTAEAFSYARDIVENKLMQFYIQLKFENPDKVSLSVFFRDFEGKYFEHDSKSGTFTVSPSDSLLTLKGVKLDNPQQDALWKYQFLSPERLRVWTVNKKEGEDSKTTSFILTKISS
ncbi:MAG: hypothetical protein NZM15_09075 [Flavobacteriales bacterium]|nr:hypothetical protein [Flavobacteriales bacterium]MDW8432839.1 hypothetical protein [Flavobacteriales bacterium]